MGTREGVFVCLSIRDGVKARWVQITTDELHEKVTCFPPTQESLRNEEARFIPAGKRNSIKVPRFLPINGNEVGYFLHENALSITTAAKYNDLVNEENCKVTVQTIHWLRYAAVSAAPPSTFRSQLGRAFRQCYGIKKSWYEQMKGNWNNGDLLPFFSAFSDANVFVPSEGSSDSSPAQDNDDEDAELQIVLGQQVDRGQDTERLSEENIDERSTTAPGYSAQELQFNTQLN